MCETVKVALRIRPLVESEISRGCQSCVRTVQDAPQVIVTGDRSFTYNYVFDSDTTQQDVYEAAIRSMVHQLFKGYNVTVLAYGQTGSGKTHTMGSNYVGEGDKGVIPQSIEDIFRHIDDHPDWQYKICVSFLELYKEQLFDLLAPERAVVEIREDTKGICIPGLTEVSVISTEAALKCLRDASAGRVTGATAMNQFSSRSHAIFTLTIHQQKVGEPHSATTAKFHMVDLAGSERSKKTQAEGDRFKEGVTINAGLLALGNVISALGEGSKQVPSYRNSKLTRLLQDSLGGNSLTLMIACISPADYNLEETLSTLRYADRARKIKNKPIVNQDPKSAEIAALKQKVQELQVQLLSQGGPMTGGVTLTNPAYEEQILEKDAKIRSLRQAYNDSLTDAAIIRERLVLAETAREKMSEYLIEFENEMTPRFDKLETLNVPPDERAHVTSLRQCFVDRLRAVQDEQKRCEDEQRRHESTYDTQDESMEAKSVDEMKLIDEQQEEHAHKQEILNKELRTVSKALASKEQFYEEYAKSTGLLGESLKESKLLVSRYEKQISDLMRERDELSRQVQLAGKSAEVDMKRSELAKKNAEIECLQKKLADQAKSVRQKEQAEKRVEQLCAEIRQMKQTKVRLIKQMKHESDQWKSWRAERERETAKLREQDRKRQNELNRLQILHSKQQNVSKRKLEEAVAMNKRLKDVLSRQKVVRSQRDGRSNKDNNDQIQDFVTQEMEILFTTLEAQRTLQQLLEDRAAVTERLAEMKRLTWSESMVKRIQASEQELELHNAQIAELQQKILDFDMENRQKTRWDMIMTMNDARSALTHTMKMTTEKFYEAVSKEREYNMLKAAREKAESKLKELQREVERLKEKHQAELINLETEHREALQAVKIGEACKGNNSTLVAAELELARKKVECDELQDKMDTILSVTVTPSIKARKRRSIHREFEDLKPTKNGYMDEDDDDFEDNDDPNDLDWRKTPVHKRLNRMRVTMGVKRPTDMFRCHCHAKCDTKRCQCFKLQSSCDENCGCDPSKCTFKLSASMLSLPGNKSSNSSNLLNDTYSVPEDTGVVKPKKRRITGCNISSPRLP